MAVQGQYSLMLQELRRTPYKLYEERPQYQGEEGYHPDLSCFQVCMCPNVGVEMRLFAENRVSELLLRGDLESLASREITILSIGAFGCYQEIVLLAKLSEVFKKFKLLLCDKKPISSENLQQFCNEVFVDAAISVEVFWDRSDPLSPCFERLKTGPLLPDVVLAIDLSDPQNEIEGSSLSSHVGSELVNNQLVSSSTIFAHSSRGEFGRRMNVETGYEKTQFSQSLTLTEDLRDSLLDRSSFALPEF